MGIDASRHRGAVALVTGAGSGIGRATTVRLAREGARVVGIDIDTARLSQTVEHLADVGVEVIPREGDVRKQVDVDAAVVAAGRVSILANVAGIADWFLPVGDVDDLTWDDVVATNLTGTMRCMRAVVAAMAERGDGAIVNISSVAGIGVVTSDGGWIPA
jgi:NAD(P)-dependent dehydrogenase (short-subunit alcohol dehydrogenase family)